MAPITGPKSLEDKKKFASVANHNTTRPVRSLVTIPAELSILAQLVQALRYNLETSRIGAPYIYIYIYIYIYMTLVA